MSLQQKRTFDSLIDQKHTPASQHRFHAANNRVKI